MRIFLTGATGSIGSAVLENLIAHGHEVTCIVRSESKATEITNKGGNPLIFTINPETAPQISDLCVGYDAIIHTAFTFSEDGIKSEHLITDAMIAAARKTAEAKPVSLLSTSGCVINGNTNGIIDEDHDDTSQCLSSFAFRPILERKICNATCGNLHAAVIRPVWVYGKSFVEDWFLACKKNNKIIAVSGNPHICFIHYEDLADMYRIIVENKAVGLFYASEPESVTLETIIERVSQAINVQEVERVSEPWSIRENYGVFPVAHTQDQQMVSKRFRDLYGYSPSHKFLEWLSTQSF